MAKQGWRREWDSNPRYGFPYTRFPSVRLQPLGHPSASAADLKFPTTVAANSVRKLRKRGTRVARTIVVGGGVATRSPRRRDAIRDPSVYPAHGAGLAHIIATKLGGALVVAVEPVQMEGGGQDLAAPEP